MLGQEFRVTQHAWVLGTLLETLLEMGLASGSECQACVRQTVTLGRPGPDSPVRQVLW